MLDMILQEARRLGVEERRRLIDLLRAQVLAELGKAGGEPDACPRCGGTHLVRKGHDRDGSQGRSCRSCGRTLSRKTMGLLGYSKLKEDVWASYVEHACAGGTLRECARACGVCLSTSWFMRMRLCEVMGRALAPFRSGPTVSCQVDGTYLNESLAGNRSRSRVGMPRGSHRCGGDVRERGISNLKVCVLCGANDLGDEFCELADRGRPTDEALGSALRAVGEGTPVSTDGLQGYARVLPRLGVSCHDATPAREARRGELGMEVRDAREARGLPGAPRGVPPGRLGHHPGWFLWDERTRGSDADRADTLSGQAATGGYDNTRLALAREPQPLWSYWGDELAVPTVA